MSTFHTIRDNIQALRNEQVAKQEKLFLIEQELERLGRSIATPKPIIETNLPGNKGRKNPFGGGVPFPGGSPPALDRQILLSLQKNQLIQQLTQIVSQLQQYFSQLWTLGSPQQLVENWSDAYPVLLLPVRVQTRFMHEINIPSQQFLGVRILPDDIFVNTHEKSLTADEIEAGKVFWQEMWKSSAVDQLKIHQGAWRVLAKGFGPERAAYIALKMQPTNWPAVSLNPPSGTPTFPSIGSKNSSWALPPRSYVLPDRFVVRLYEGANIREVEGQPITAYPLHLGPDPNSPSNEMFAEDGNGALIVEDKIKWLFDFNRAVSEGMAIKIPLTNLEFNQGFDKIVVLGLRLSSDTVNSRLLLEDMFESHQYGPTGLSLAPQGMPTNNTKDKPTDFSSWRPDVEAAFRLEQNTAVVGNLNMARKDEWVDGQWLHHCLGLKKKAFERIGYANHTDRREAMLMNEALWPSTLGYYFKHLLAERNILNNNTFSPQDTENIKDFFIKHIIGRGSLPAIRVGAQPYGILPVSAYSRMAWVATELPANKIHNALQFFMESWKQKIPGIKTVDSGGNWQQNYLDILGLHAGSVEFHQRSGFGHLLYYLLLRAFNSGNPAVADLWLSAREVNASTIKTTINSLFTGDLLNSITRASMLTWSTGANPIIAPLICPEPLSESNELLNNYLKRLSSPLTRIGIKNITKDIVKEYLSGQSVPDGYNTLLYRLLRHAILLEIWETLWKKDKATPWIEKEYLNLLPNSPCESIWHRYVDQKSLEMNEEALDYLCEQEHYKKMLSLLFQLQGVPTARLERLLTEHLDLCSYRLDAWFSGLIDYRLQTMRADQPEGTHLGAYGWLLDVRKDPDRTTVPDPDIPAPFTNTASEYPLTYEYGNAGFIHAPSIAQATTSAVLREGYLSKGEQAMEVNISSKRVRLALEIIQGIQNGQELGALLGYRFERSLHEKSENSSLELNKYVYQLRKKFPLTTEPVQDQAVEANNVVHGLNLLHSYRKNEDLGITPENLIIDSIQELEDIIDAIADLTMAEGVHQSILGNHVRANAILNAIGEGKRIPNPEFIETPRSGIALTQRVVILFKTDVTTLWNPTASSYRAMSEPILNGWIGSVLGNPTKIKCKISYTLDVGTNQETAHHFVVSLLDLGVEPIDALILLNTSMNEGSSELSKRIALMVRKSIGLSKDIPIKIDYRNRDGWPLNEKTFYEMLPLARTMYKALADGQPLAPEHLQNAASLNSADNLVSKYDLKELKERADNLAIKFNSLKIAISKPLTKIDVITDFTGLDEQNLLDTLCLGLIKAANANIAGVMPESAVDYDKESVSNVKNKAKRALAEIETKLNQFDGIMSNLPNAPELEGLKPEDLRKKKDALIQAIQVLIGKDVPIIPKFKLNNLTSLKSCHDDRTSLLRHSDSPLVVDDWLQGMAKVREKVQNWQLFTILSDGLEAGINQELIPLQLPYQPNDQWIGITYDESVIKIAPDPLSLVLNFPNGFPDTDTVNYCGVLIDEWIEKIPTRQETTGITFHYEEPQTEPPQALLLVVPPEINGTWKWNDLMDALNETLEMAKVRAIDPDLLGEHPGSSFNLFLPGIVHAVSSDHKQTIAFNLGDLNTGN